MLINKGEKTMKQSITLPEKNMVNGKYRSGDYLTSQFCVIPNSEENRNAIDHMNKLAKEQNSKYRIKKRYRVPVAGKKYGRYGELSCENAQGIGLYIDGKVEHNAHLKNAQWRISDLMTKMRKNMDEIEHLNNKIASLRKVNVDLMKQNAELKKPPKDRAVCILEERANEYMRENGQDRTHDEMINLIYEGEQ